MRALTIRIRDPVAILLLFVRDPLLVLALALGHARARRHQHLPRRGVDRLLASRVRCHAFRLLVGLHPHLKLPPRQSPNPTMKTIRRFR